MIVPGRLMLVLGGALAVVMVAATVHPMLFWVALTGDVLIIVAILIQGRQLKRQRVTIERENWHRLEIGRKTDLVFRIENRGIRPMTVVLRQHWPSSFDAEENKLDLAIEPGQVVRAAIAVTAHQRGPAKIRPIQVDQHTRYDLAHFRSTLDDQTVINVYPNLSAIAEYDMMRRHHALGQYGVHRTRMVGTGREFDQLRDYLPDDNFGDVNWKATARRRQLVTNVYRAERSQDVILCLDCGRMMGNPLGGGTVLDRVIDASSMLVHVCGRSGDRVGLVLFRDTVTRYIKPMRPGRSSNRIINELVSATPEGVFPSYMNLVAALRSSQTQRGMVFIFTDLNDPQLASDLTSALPLVSRRHVVVVISLKDPLLEQVASGPAKDRRGVCQVLAARHLAEERTSRVRQLTKAGVQVLEVDADSITLDAINAYLAIKMRQLV